MEKNQHRNISFPLTLRLLERPTSATSRSDTWRKDNALLVNAREQTIAPLACHVEFPSMGKTNARMQNFIMARNLDFKGSLNPYIVPNVYNVNMVNCVNVPSTRVPNLLHLPIPRRVTNALEPCHTYTAMQNGVIDLSGFPIPIKAIGGTKPMLFQDREQFKPHSSNAPDVNAVFMCRRARIIRN